MNQTDETRIDNLDVGKLSSIYQNANEVDHYIFSEQRSNILLAMGEHYNNNTFSRLWGRLRENRQNGGDDQQRLRITKNHIHRITRIIINNITTQSPGVSIMPQRESELADQKAAELNGAVWEDIKHRHRIREKVGQWADDFVVPGEVAVKVFWDPSAGKFLGYEQESNERGEPQFDDGDNPLPSNRAVFTGDLVYDRIPAFNVLRDPNSRELHTGMKIIRKMVDIGDLRAKYAGDEEKLEMIQQSRDDVYQVFSGTTGGYSQTKNQTMVKEFYWDKSASNPEGWFYMATDIGILEKGPLPFGIFPIVMTGWDELQTTPRRRSIIKQLRPTQAEINRVASAIATAQVTLGQDKLLVASGTKITQGAMLPGVRVVKYSGVPPTHLPGRAGDQYFEYLGQQINELYQIAGIPDENETKQQNQDMMVELMKSVKQKKRFSMYVEKFERFLQDVCEKSLRLAKEYYTDDMLVPAIGKNEYINVAEFRDGTDLGHKIVIEPQAEDYETKMGKQITLTNLMQYGSQHLEKDDYGKIMRLMPYTNKEQMLSDWTLDYDNVTNDILAMDRGNYPQTDESENHKYAIKRLTHRTKQADFQFLDPQVQEHYKMKISEHSQVEAAQLKAIQDAQNEQIPASGALVKADMYVPDPENPSKTGRAKVPMDALQWLLDKLQAQNINLAEMERLQQGAAADIAQKFLSEGQVPQQPIDREGMDAAITEQRALEALNQ